MVHDLKQNWKEFAVHLGFSDKEISGITVPYPTTHRQIQMFLRAFRMPDLKKRTEFILYDIFDCNNLHSPRDMELPPDQSQEPSVKNPPQVNFHFYSCTSPPSIKRGQWQPLEKQFVPIGSPPTPDAEIDSTSVTDSEPDSHRRLPEKKGKLRREAVNNV